jgi:hypothetical protein
MYPIDSIKVSTHHWSQYTNTFFLWCVVLGVLLFLLLLFVDTRASGSNLEERFGDLLLVEELAPNE